MGLLDQMGNLSPEQTQGLLAFAAQTLQAGGPSRTPIGFGQALGAGIQGYQTSTAAYRKQKQEAEQAAQIAQLTGLKIKDAQSDLANQDAARQRQEDLRKFYIGRTQGAPLGAVQTPAAMGDSLAPTMENAQRMQAMQPAAGASAPQGAGGNQNQGIYHQRLQQAQELRNAGFGTEADAAEAAALKFQPKVKGWEKVQQGDKVMFAPFFEDGTSGAPVPLEVAEKLQFQNAGGKTLGLNPFTGQQVSSFANSQSPDNMASVAATIRGQNLTDARGLESNQISRDRLAVDKAPTEFQGKSAAFGLRATEADKILTSLQGKYSPAAINSKMQVSEWPLVGGALGASANAGLTSQDQQAEQGQRDFINAVLRQESGAAIGASEFDNARKQYFPQPNDKPEVVAQKARNRQLAVQGLQSNAGRARMTAPAAPAAPGGWSIQRVGE